MENQGEEDNPDFTRVEDFSEPPDSAPPAAPPSDTMPDDSAIPTGVVLGVTAASAAAASAAAASAAASSTGRTGAAASSSAAAPREAAEGAPELGIQDGADGAGRTSPDVVVAIDDPGKGVGDTVPSPRSAVSYVDAIDGWALLAGLLVTSTAVLIACLVDTVDPVGRPYGSGYLFWALAGSITSLVITVLLMVLKQFAEHASIKVSPGASVFVLALWLAVSMPATFSAPFPDLGNGWLGCWTSVAVSGALAFRALKDKAQAVSDAVSTRTSASKAAVALGLASVVLLIAASVSYGGGTSGVSAGVKVCGGATGAGGYAIAVGAVSLACSMGIFAATLSESCNPQINMGLSIFLALWWSIGAFIITFVGPFHSTGCSMNGYVATWASLFAALALFKACGLDTVKECFTKMKGGSGKPPREEQRVADELPAL